MQNIIRRWVANFTSSWQRLSLFGASICTFAAALALVLSNAEKIRQSYISLFYPNAPKILIREVLPISFPSLRTEGDIKIFYVLRIELTIEKTGDSEANECEVRLRYRIGSEPMYAMDEIKHGTFVKTLKNFRPGNYSSTFKVTFYLSPNLPSHIKTLRANGEQPRVSVSCSESSVSDWVPVSISVSGNE